MFDYFVTFTEVIKLSPIIYYQLQYIEPDNEVIKLCFIKSDLDSIIGIYHRIEDKTLIFDEENYYLKNNLNKLPWSQFYYKVITTHFGIDKVSREIVCYIIETFVNFGRTKELKDILDKIEFKNKKVEFFRRFSNIQNYHDNYSKYGIASCILLQSVKINNLENIKFILPYTSVNVCNGEAMNQAIQNRNFEMIRYLVERPDCIICKESCCHGSNVRLIGKYHMNYLEKNKCYDICDYLISKGSCIPLGIRKRLI